KAGGAGVRSNPCATTSRRAVTRFNVPRLHLGTYLRYGSRPRPQWYHPHRDAKHETRADQTDQNWRRSMPTKTPEKKASAAKTNALQKLLQPSEELAAVVGADPLPRGQVVSKMWEYIRSHDLQNPENRREILAD